MATKLLAVQKLGKLFTQFFIRFNEKIKPAMLAFSEVISGR